MSSVGAPFEVITAIGGGAKSSLWVQMLADSLGLPVGVSETVEASSLGAAMIAAFGAGWYPSIDVAAASMGSRLSMTQPVASRHSRYLELMDIHASVYSSNAATVKALRAFGAASV